MSITQTFHTTKLTDGTEIWYREAGDPSKPVFLLLHGFPTSSNMFRHLIPLLAPYYHVIAPDLPGYGFTTYPEDYLFTFKNLSNSIELFINSLNIKKYALYVFDYGAPTGFHLMLKDPTRCWGLVSQNGNAYEVGLDDRFWAPFRKYWAATPDDPSLVPVLKEWLKDEKNVSDQYLTGVVDQSAIEPASYLLDYYLLVRDGQNEVQLALAYDYKNNLVDYPKFHEMFREYNIPTLAIWGKNDEIFKPEGAEAYKQDCKSVKVELIESGHFALEDSVEKIAAEIIDFLKDFGSK